MLERVVKAEKSSTFSYTTRTFTLKQRIYKIKGIISFLSHRSF
ncbi:hypothetical protein HMPREF3211_02385 [Staphylococcus aureus]|nr:hypothetical protein HMPREF3211_02385 [Staphylococcus aureus]